MAVTSSLPIHGVCGMVKEHVYNYQTITSINRTCLQLCNKSCLVDLMEQIRPSQKSKEHLYTIIQAITSIIEQWCFLQLHLIWLLGIHWPSDPLTNPLTCCSSKGKINEHTWWVEGIGDLGFLYGVRTSQVWILHNPEHYTIQTTEHTLYSVIFLNKLQNTHCIQTCCYLSKFL